MGVEEDVKLEGLHASVTIRRPAPRVVVLVVDGADVGELGERPFEELTRDLDSEGTLQLFVDARAALGPSIDVSGHWASWLGNNQLRFDHVTNNRFRHGTKFLRWRPDKNPKQCTFEQMLNTRRR